MGCLKFELSSSKSLNVACFEVICSYFCFRFVNYLLAFTTLFTRLVGRYSLHVQFFRRFCVTRVPWELMNGYFEMKMQVMTMAMKIRTRRHTRSYHHLLGPLTEKYLATELYSEHFAPTV